MTDSTLCKGCTQYPLGRDKQPLWLINEILSFFLSFDLPFRTFPSSLYLLLSLLVSPSLSPSHHFLCLSLSELNVQGYIRQRGVIELRELAFNWIALESRPPISQSRVCRTPPAHLHICLLNENFFFEVAVNPCCLQEISFKSQRGLPWGYGGTHSMLAQ